MTTTLRFFCICPFILFSFFACNTSEKPSENTTKNTTANSLKSLPNEDFANFIQQTKTAESGTEIPLSLHQKFIQPTLVGQQLHPYIASEKATYSYGQILYEEAEMVAFTFYYKAIQDKNLLAGSFMATYNPITAAFIDCKMVFGSSTFDFQQTKGYNLGFSCRSDMEFIESDDLVLILKSQIKYFYSAFRKGLEPKANSVNTHRYTLLRNGMFVFG
jgi:hypothetical protein